MATQLIVWEFVSGCRSTNDGYKCTNTKFIDGQAEQTPALSRFTMRFLKALQIIQLFRALHRQSLQRQKPMR